MPTPPAGPLFAVIRLRARPGRAEAAERALRRIIAPTRANPDCLEFRVLRDRDDPRAFTLLEHWTSRAATDAHGESDCMTGYLATREENFEVLSVSFVHALQP
ncbi:putative quinol monooxygenase [Streptomyces sp. SPB074]|uniref:putative quinol monooxygenase n=1 Tax=Streptomyces sp. (strain SPB074) TaxID=465543 RepID=UPI00017F17FB|nr:putative quinol monooxygenase [Streptomyces sp. SPB074]EDY45840.1 antibiotic biosynthesis monooxygenase subfamily [Streptomyces sp. SPB074]